MSFVQRKMPSKFIAAESTVLLRSPLSGNIEQRGPYMDRRSLQSRNFGRRLMNRRRSDNRNPELANGFEKLYSYLWKGTDFCVVNRNVSVLK
jgi:hypothetical protein